MKKTDTDLQITNANKLILAIGLLFIIIGMFYKIATANLLPAQTSDTNNVIEYAYGRTIHVGQNILKLKIADTEESRINGLSNTTSLCSECSMLFVFPKVGAYSFWMKDMNYDIDIIYIDENMKVIDVYDHVLKSEYPKTYVSNSPAKYVLEINAGKSQELQIKEGDIVKYQ